MSFYEFARGLFRMQFRTLKWQISGVENIPKEGAVILAVNHISNWDPILVACGIERKINFMAKIELFRVPGLGALLRTFGAFPVKRGEGDMAAIRQALDILKEGEILGIFPEGHRSKTGNVLKGMPGMVLLMEKSKAPVVPIKVYGTRRLFWHGRGKVGMVVGEPLQPEMLKAPEGVPNRREWIANHIMEQVEALPESKL